MEQWRYRTFNHSTRWEWVVRFTPRPLCFQRKNPGTHWTGGWVGPRAGLEVMAKIKILPRRGPNPGLPAQHQSRYRATIPTLKVEQTWSVANNVTMSTRNERRVSISVNEIYSVTLLLSELSFNTPLSNLVIHCDTTGCSCSFRS
jgi:hypothetical protein